jgi:hypothetical protein
MTADLPDELVRRVARRLGSRTRASTVTESLGRDIWIDYVADTGDDVSVSRAVATLIFAQYELPDPSNPGTRLRAPRGDLLLFGGDTAYPVATAEEIRGRIVEPFNSVLDGRVDNGSRVVLGIPGNHDWYDGLDGFGRLFRRHLDDNPYGTLRPSADTRHPTVLARTAAWTREFVRGGKVKKPRTLELIGYGAVQGASYFALPLAPGVCMLAVDRQLKEIDVRQQRFFESFLNQRLSVTPWLVLPDPVHAFGEPSETGVGMVDALGLTLSARAHFVLSGDIHHYRREQDGKTLHVTAGGGGAFLHPAAIRPRGKLKAQVEFPSVAQSRRLLRRVPAKVALGRSGFLPHLAFLALFAPTLWFERTSFEQIETVLVPATIVTLTLTLLYALIGGVRRGHRVTIAFAFVAALLTAALPAIAMAAMEWMWHSVDIQLPPRLVQLLLWGTAAFIGAYIFGSYLALLTRLGFENTQAFTALDHPGFKHFVRLRVRADGSRVDAWCLGLVDPLSDEKPVLVDSFTWFPRL